jgi:hypothetical protein
LRLTDSRAKDKNFLRLLVRTWGGSGERREAGLAKTVIAQRQILFLATTFDIQV